MSGRFAATDTPISGLKVLDLKRIGDERGFLERLFCAEELASLLGDRSIAQVNHTLTARRGTVRGMHFQNPPYAELKLVTCIRGTVFDVAVDVRRGSRTFLQWHGEVLGAAEPRTFVIPEGFAHGFQALTDDCELLYLHTAAYEPSSEGAVSALDPRLRIAWPEQVGEMSARDASHPPITDAFEGVAV